VKKLLDCRALAGARAVNPQSSGFLTYQTRSENCMKTKITKTKTKAHLIGYFREGLALLPVYQKIKPSKKTSA
jgi:hypothetical protein